MPMDYKYNDTEIAEDNVDDEPVVIEEYSYALAIYVVDVNSDYQYNTDRYDTGLAEYAIVDKREEVKEMFAQFSEMTSTLFKRRKEKAEKELMAFANILVAEYNNTKEKINYYIAENVKMHTKKQKRRKRKPVSSVLTMFVLFINSIDFA